MFLENLISRRMFIQKSVTGIAAMNNLATSDLRFAEPASQSGQSSSIPDKLVVLTFDDAVKSHRTFVAPLLEQLGFGATFFVTHRWMDDRENFLSWKEIAEIHEMGFEIGNHTWTHDNFSTARNAARLAGELALVESELGKVGVPRPVSFAYPGDNFGPEAIEILAERGYRWARRGMQPEVEYGERQIGPLFDPQEHSPLLIPTTGDAYPDWAIEYFEQVVSHARNGKIVVLQFHGVPDRVHPWVYTPPENFRSYMFFLKENGFQAIGLRDLQRHTNLESPPDDPTLKMRYPKPRYGCPDLPLEASATQADLRYWLENMLRYHRYTLAEAAKVCGLTEDVVEKKVADFGLYPPPPVSTTRRRIRVLPYPGGRHPRVGFREGAIDPLRGTKASIFLPWDPTSYVLADLPEAIFSNLGLIFLAHTHLPTIWNDQNLVLENIDWSRGPDGCLSYHRTLPNGIVFGASIQAVEDHIAMELWLRNFSGQNLSGLEMKSGLRTQVCVMLKGAPEFESQTNDNKIFRNPVAAVRSLRADRWILTAWEHCGRVWGNPAVPCVHSDPDLPGCPFGNTVRARGRMWFYEGTEIQQELERAGASF